MKFETLGKPESPAVVLIHGSLCSAASSRRFGQYLQNDYHVIMPTLDGHTGDTNDYDNAASQAARILQYLLANGVTKVALLHGTSMGAVVALEMAHQNAVLQQLRGSENSMPEIEKIVLDGGVFFRFPGVVRWMLLQTLRFTARSLRGDDRVHAVDKTLYSWRLRSMMGKQPDAHRPMIEDMYDTCRNVSKATLAAIAESCYNVSLPPLDGETAGRCWFHYGRKEMAAAARKSLLKAYPQASFREDELTGHCTKQLKDPEQYAGYLRSIMRGEEPADPKPDIKPGKA